jgi:hypothetical protein
MPHIQIVINVSGGLVQDVYCSAANAEVTLVDFDVDGGNSDEPGLLEIISAGRPERVFVDQFTSHDLQALVGTDVEKALLAVGELV